MTATTITYPITLVDGDTNGTLPRGVPRPEPWVHTMPARSKDLGSARRLANALVTAMFYLVKERLPVPAPSGAGRMGTGREMR